MTPKSPAPGAARVEDPSGGPAFLAHLGQDRFGRWLGLWLVLLLALLVRVAYHLEHRQSLEYAVPTVDARYHDLWARHMLGQPLDWQSGEGSAAVFEGPSLRPIGYPWFLAGVYALTGGSHSAALIVQHLLGVLAVAILWLSLHGRAGPGLATLVAGVWGLHFAPVYLEGELHATSLLLVWQLAGLWAFLRVLEGAGWRWAAGAGLCFGVATLVRPNVLLPALCLAVVAGGLPRLWSQPAGRWRTLGILVAGLVAGCLPGTIRNLAVSGQWVPFTATAGLNLYLGQGPEATGVIDSDLGELGRFRTCFDYPDVKAHVERRLGRELDEAQLDDWFASQAWQHMAQDPGRALGLLATKAALLLHPIEIGHNKEVELEVRHAATLRFLPLPFTGLMAWLLWGLFAGIVHWRTNRGEQRVPTRTSGELRVLWVHGIWAVGFALSLLPFFAASRYRVPWLPHLMVVACLSGWPLLRQQAAVSQREVFRWASALAVAAVLIAWLCIGKGLPGLTPYAGPYPARWHGDRGMTAAQLGQLQRAREEFQAALQIDPDHRTALLELATLDLREERWEEARQGYERVLALDPTHPKALFNLGYLAQIRQDFPQALEFYRRAHGAAPTLSEPRAAHAQLVWQLAAHPQAGRREAHLALQAMQAWMGERPGSAQEWELLAACQAKLGQWPAARTSVQRALELARREAPDSSLIQRIEAARERYDRKQAPRLPAN